MEQMFHRFCPPNVTPPAGEGSVDLALAFCPSFDVGGDDRVSIDELIRAVNAALKGCGVASQS
jgi:hypothetical protein